MAPLTVSGEDKPVAIFSYEDTSCGAWAKSSGDTMGRAQYDSWFRGFVSGYNYGNPDNQVPLNAMPNEETLHLFIDKYCRENPLKPFVSSAFELVKELRENPTRKKNKGQR
jgi:hypothetical protein